MGRVKSKIHLTVAWRTHSNAKEFRQLCGIVSSKAGTDKPQDVDCRRCRRAFPRVSEALLMDGIDPGPLGYPPLVLQWPDGRIEKMNPHRDV